MCVESAIADGFVGLGVDQTGGTDRTSCARGKNQKNPASLQSRIGSVKWGSFSELNNTYLTAMSVDDEDCRCLHGLRYCQNLNETITSPSLL